MHVAAIGRSTDVPKPVVVTVLLCFLIATLEGYDIQALGVAARALRAAFLLDDRLWGWLTASSGVGVVCGAYLGGRIADARRRKPVLVGAVIVSALFTLAMIVVPNTPLLFVTRTIAGLGFGAALPMMMAMAAEISDQSRQALVGAVMFCGLPAGGGSAALLARLLPAGSSWKILFVVGGVIPLLLVPALLLRMRETLRGRRRESTSRVATTDALFGGGRTVPTVLLWLIFLPTMSVVYLCLNWLTSLIGGRHLGDGVAFEAQLAFNYVSIPGAVLLSLWVDRAGPRWPLTLGFGALAGALIGLAHADTHASIVAYCGLTGFLVLGANYALYAVAAAYYPMHMRGTGSGVSVAVGRLGGILGPLMAGQLLAAGITPVQLISGLAPLAAIACLSALVLSFYPRAND